MKAKRIGQLKTYLTFSEGLSDAAVKYLKKSGCEDSATEILTDIRLNCHNPRMYCLVVGDPQKVDAFVVAMLTAAGGKKLLVIEHLYAPNQKLAAGLYRLVKKLAAGDSEQFDTVFVTYRDPDAWIRFGQKHKVPLKVKSYLLTEE